MKLKKLLLHMLFIVCAVQSSASFALDVDRGLRNYKSVMSGQKKLEQLSAPEKQEVLFIHQQLSGRNYGNQSPECKDAIDTAISAADELSSSSRRLSKCAEAKSWDDDCEREFRRVRNDHSDYESAVGEVQSTCN